MCDKKGWRLMQWMLNRGVVGAGCVAVCLGVLARADAQQAAPKEDGKKRVEVRLADGALRMTAPATWQVKKPKFGIIEYEFAGPRVEGDSVDARITIMGAGGSVSANIDRWKAQFRKVTSFDQKEKKVGGVTVHIVDIQGVFRDRRGGPFSGAPEKLLSDHRMLGAIIVTPKKGRYFVKMYGPKKTIAKHAAGFRQMLDSVKIAD